MSDKELHFTYDTYTDTQVRRKHTHCDMYGCEGKGEYGPHRVDNGTYMSDYVLMFTQEATIDYR